MCMCVCETAWAVRPGPRLCTRVCETTRTLCPGPRLCTRVCETAQAVLPGPPGAAAPRRGWGLWWQVSCRQFNPSSMWSTSALGRVGWPSWEGGSLTALDSDYRPPRGFDCPQQPHSAPWDPTRGSPVGGMV